MEKIADPIRRRVEFRKRIRAIFKEARELNILCDAEIFCIVVSETRDCTSYITPSINEKEAIDRYQRALGIDLWSEEYERLKETLEISSEVNTRLRREIGMRTGDECLNDLSFGELCDLELQMEDSLEAFRQLRHRKIRIQIDRCSRKIHMLESLIHDHLAHLGNDQGYEVVDNGDKYESCVTTNSSISQPSLDSDAESVLTRRL